VGQGTIVAPAAAVQFNNGHIDGSFFVASVTGNGTQLCGLLFGRGVEHSGVCAGEIHPFPPITPPCPITPCPPCPTVGPLPPFTAFAIGDLTSKGSDDLGTMAAGGNINLVDYSINLQDPFNGTCEIALVAGGSISYLNGQVRGSVYAGASSNLTDVTQPTGCVNGHNVGKDTIVNFDAAAKNLQVTRFDTLHTRLFAYVGTTGWCVQSERQFCVRCSPCHQPNPSHVRSGHVANGCH
jgi:hypothetical protein